MPTLVVVDQWIGQLFSRKGAYLLAVVFCLLWLWRGRGTPASRRSLTAAGLWVGYAAYETALAIYQPANREIRVDFLLLLPLLAIVSALAIAALVKHRR
jgi:hypothetical protein